MIRALVNHKAIILLLIEPKMAWGISISMSHEVVHGNCLEMNGGVSSIAVANIDEMKGAISGHELYGASFLQVSSVI